MPTGERATKALHKKARRGFNGYPVATVAYYGPDKRRASKVAVAIIPDDGADPDALERWFNDERDVRLDHRINERIVEFIHGHEVRSVVMTDGIIGCPHEEGIDYPEGGTCPRCPFWAERDRWADEGSQHDTHRAGGASAERAAALAEMLQQPCPCGSGKAMADCCAGDGFAPAGEQTRAIMRELEQLAEGRAFDSQEALQAFLDGHLGDHNRRPLDDLAGLSPEQMQALLYRPFATLPLADLQARLMDHPPAPVLDLFDLIADAAADRGIKLTARGNLPRKLVKAGHGRLRELGVREAEIHTANTERDVRELHNVRVVADLAGLLRKSRGYLYLTRRAEKLLDGDRPGLYGRLLETWCTRFNWAYGDGFGDLRTIQMSFGFTLYLLHRYGADRRPSAFYEDAFLRAFPMVLEESDDDGAYLGPERRVRLAWSLRTLHGLGFLFGLVELAGPDGPVPLLASDGLQVRATPLLNIVFPEPPPG